MHYFNQYRNVFLNFILVIGVVLSYNLKMWNNFFPITEGWFSVYANLILNAKVPYKDFYLLLPPLYPIILALIIKIFGNQIIVLRILGLGVILVISSSMFYILKTRIMSL